MPLGSLVNSRALSDDSLLVDVFTTYRDPFQPHILEGYKVLVQDSLPALMNNAYS